MSNVTNLHSRNGYAGTLYDQETEDIIASVRLAAERIEVVEAAQASFRFAIAAIRGNDLRASDGLLDSMQDTFDNMARIAKAVVA